MTEPDPVQLRARIQNALLLLDEERRARATGSRGTGAAALELAAEALRGSLEALDDLERQLDVATDPDAAAARDVVALERVLSKERERARRAELERVALRAEVEARDALLSEDRARIAALERRLADHEAVLLSDDESFRRYMDRALGDGDGDRRGGGRGP